MPRYQNQNKLFFSGYVLLSDSSCCGHERYHDVSISEFKKIFFVVQDIMTYDKDKEDTFSYVLAATY